MMSMNRIESTIAMGMAKSRTGHTWPRARILPYQLDCPTASWRVLEMDSEVGMQIFPMKGVVG
jgi:hypothetical protein